MSESKQGSINFCALVSWVCSRHLSKFEEAKQEDVKLMVAEISKLIAAGQYSLLNINSTCKLLDNIVYRQVQYLKEIQEWKHKFAIFDTAPNSIQLTYRNYQAKKFLAVPSFFLDPVLRFSTGHQPEIVPKQNLQKALQNNTKELKIMLLRCTDLLSSQFQLSGNKVVFTKYGAVLDLVLVQGQWLLIKCQSKYPWLISKTALQKKVGELLPCCKKQQASHVFRHLKSGLKQQMIKAYFKHLRSEESKEQTQPRGKPMRIDESGINFQCFFSIQEDYEFVFGLRLSQEESLLKLSCSKPLRVFGKDSLYYEKDVIVCEAGAVEPSLQLTRRSFQQNLLKYLFPFDVLVMYLKEIVLLQNLIAHARRGSDCRIQLTTGNPFLVGDRKAYSLRTIATVLRTGDTIPKAIQLKDGCQKQLDQSYVHFVQYIDKTCQEGFPVTVPQRWIQFQAGILKAKLIAQYPTIQYGQIKRVQRFTIQISLRVDQTLSFGITIVQKNVELSKFDGTGRQQFQKLFKIVLRKAPYFKNTTFKSSVKITPA